MKSRNQWLALFCLLVFAAFGFLYVRTWVVQKPFGIILFISDSMVVRQLTAARLYEGGADHRLALEGFPHLALLRNPALDFAVPDDAAAATAFATGEKVRHRHLAFSESGERRSILELARLQGRTVGVVTSGHLLDPTPAAFYAHLADSRETEQVAKQLLETAPLDVFLGGGAFDFLPAERGGRRKDHRDLLQEMRGKKWDIVRSNAELENASTYRTGPLVGLFADDHLAFSNQIESGSQQPTLASMVQRAIQFLEVNGKGYVLVVDAALATTAAERNEGERAIRETLALDSAVSAALKYAGEKSLILVTGKHSTGGMSLNGYPLVPDHGVALLGVNASGQPAITWATGPNGPLAATPPGLAPVPNDEHPIAVNKADAFQPGARTEPAAFQTPAALNNAEDVIVVGRGAGSERLHGFLENTDVFEILKSAL